MCTEKIKIPHLHLCMWFSNENEAFYSKFLKKNREREREKKTSPMITHNSSLHGCFSTIFCISAVKQDESDVYENYRSGLRRWLRLMGNERHAAAGREKKKHTKEWECVVVVKKLQKWGSLCFSLSARFMQQKHMKGLIFLLWLRSLCERERDKSSDLHQMSGKNNSRSELVLYRNKTRRTNCTQVDVQR